MGTGPYPGGHERNDPSRASGRDGQLEQAQLLQLVCQQRAADAVRCWGLQLEFHDHELRHGQQPALVNIDTLTEENQLFDLIFAHGSSAIWVYVVNSIPFPPGTGGIMKDLSCNPDNVNRGCYILSTGVLATDRRLFTHELAHVFNLPHIRESTSPRTGQNDNLMSYGMNSMLMSSNITREVGPPCFLYIPPTMNQLEVMNNWAHMHTSPPVRTRRVSGSRTPGGSIFGRKGVAPIGKACYT